MAFRSDLAAQTLGQTIDALVAGWSAIDAETRQKIVTLIRKHGPLIGNFMLYNAMNVPGRISALLDDLWLLKTVLPAPAVQALQSGLVPADPKGWGTVGIIRVPDDDRLALLRSVARIVDFRVFDNPTKLAAQLDSLVDSRQDRLLEGERAAWTALHQAFAQGGDAATYIQKVAELLKDYPAVEQLIAPHRLWAPQPLRQAEITLPKGMIAGPSRDVAPIDLPFAPPPPSAGSERSVAQTMLAAQPPAGGGVTRYANVNFPSKVLITQRLVPLVIQIALEHEAWSIVSADESSMTLKLGDLTIMLFAEGFDLAASFGGLAAPGAVIANGVASARTVKVQSDTDAEPVVYLLDPQSAGIKQIKLDFFQFGRNILTLSFQSTVVTDPADMAGLANVAVDRVLVQSAVLGKDGQPPDLVLRVVLSADQKTLFYILHSATDGDYNFKPAGQVTLTADPQTYLKGTFDRLSTLAKLSSQARTPEQTAAAKRELADIGINLYAELIPPELKAEYRNKISKDYAGKGLLITSDEPWIPWEMVRPYEIDQDGNELYDDPPLCEKFQLTRWLAGRGAPDLVKMQNGVWVAPPDNLAAAQDESDYFTELRRRQWTIHLDGPLSALSEVDTRFRDGSTELFHFACHGNFNTDDPNESRLKLAGDFLRPSQIIGQRQAGLRKSKPVVFLNACYGGRVGVGLTQLGGWAQRFIDAGASAFIGSLWEINDALAARFAKAFYDRLWGVGEFAGKPPQPLGQAFNEARLAIKAEDEANPTWLAYVLYGDPQGQVVLGG